MTSQQHAGPPLALRTASLEDIQAPFEGDLLRRRAVAERLTRYIDRLPEGAVIALDAPWGEGKSWFGRHWEASLKQRGHRVGWIDAFQQDYAEDAFLLLSSAILALCAQDATTAEKIKRSASQVMRALLPVGTKALINLAGRAIGTTDLVDEFADAVDSVGEKAADATSAWVKKRLEHWAEEQKTVAHFRQVLTEFADAAFEKTGKPVVILIDELDRCRPAFAVRLIERIKHFFDVPKLVFVLLMNRDQLEKAIRGVYGSETDASTYLGKFLHLSLSLPKERSRERFDRNGSLNLFVRSVLARSGNDADDDFANTFSVWAAAFDLSLRDIERGCALYALAGNNHHYLVSYLIALKLKRPALYRSLSERVGMTAMQAHKTCREQLLGELAALMRVAVSASTHRDLGFPGNYFHALTLLHTFHADGNAFLNDSEAQAHDRQQLQAYFGNVSWDTALERAMRSLDLDVQ